MNLDNDLLERINKITSTKYTEPITEDDVISIIEEIVNEYEHLLDRYNDLEQQIEDNFKPIPVAEQVGISDRDFY